MPISTLWRPLAAVVLMLAAVQVAEAQSVVDTLQAEWAPPLGATAASTPPPYPVVFVHGLDSEDRTWQTTIQQLQAEGWGTPYSYHFDLNASYSTYYLDDVPAVLLQPFWESASATPGANSPVRVGDRAHPAGTTSSRLFLANFRNTYDAATNVMNVHDDWDIAGESNSNESAVVKQAYALSYIIGDVLAWTGSDRVILMGHSMGGLAIREYLQRRQPGGAPTWWVDPADGESGHRVAGVVTTGTPHQGSNSWDGGIFTEVDFDSEAVRDVRYTYTSAGGEIAPYLYGGDENITAYWHNDDVNADGDVLDAIGGLNSGNPTGILSGDNPAHPLPRNVRYIYIYSSFSGGGDGVVATHRQYPVWVAPDNTVYYAPSGLATARLRNWRHDYQTDDVDAIRAALTDAVFTAGEEGPAATAAVSVYPNPTRGPLSVSFELDRPARVGATLADVLGRVVLALPPAELAAGPQRPELDAADLPAGVYVLTLSVDGAARPGQLVTVVR